MSCCLMLRCFFPSGLIARMLFRNDQRFLIVSKVMLIGSRGAGRPIRACLDALIWYRRYAALCSALESVTTGIILICLTATPRLLLCLSSQLPSIKCLGFMWTIYYSCRKAALQPLVTKLLTSKFPLLH